MAYNYEYNPSITNKTKKRLQDSLGNKRHNFIGSKSNQRLIKNATIVGSVLVLLYLVGMLGNSYTGLVTHQKNIESELDNAKIVMEEVKVQKQECESNLFSTIEKFDECENNFENKADELLQCGKERDEFKKHSEELNDFYTSCLNEKEAAESDYESVSSELEIQQNDYKKLVRNSVRSACCSVNDIVSGNTRYFDIENGVILCKESGGFTINCGNGETTY